jgi:hypothetical protein
VSLGRRESGKGWQLPLPLLLGTKAGWFDQTNLIASGCELTALITLHNHSATGFDPDHPGANPAQGG